MSTEMDVKSLEVWRVPLWQRPPARRYTNCSEGFFLLDGVVSIVLDGTELRAEAGEFVLVPRAATRRPSERRSSR